MKFFVFLILFFVNHNLYANIVNLNQLNNILNKEKTKILIDLKFERFLVVKNILFKKEGNLLDAKYLFNELALDYNEDKKTIVINNKTVNVEKYLKNEFISIKDLEKILSFKIDKSLETLELFIVDYDFLIPRLKILKKKAFNVRFKRERKKENYKITKKNNIVKLRQNHNYRVQKNGKDHVVTTRLKTNIMNSQLFYSNTYTQNKDLLNTRLNHSFLLKKNIFNKNATIELGDIARRSDKYFNERFFSIRGAGIRSINRNSLIEKIKLIELEIEPNKVVEIYLNDNLFRRIPFRTSPYLLREEIPLFSGYNQIRVKIINENGLFDERLFEEYVNFKIENQKISYNLESYVEVDPRFSDNQTKSNNMNLSIPTEYGIFGVRGTTTNSKMNIRSNQYGLSYQNYYKGLTYGLLYLKNDNNNIRGNAKQLNLRYSFSNGLTAFLEKTKFNNFESFVYDRDVVDEDILRLRYSRHSFKYYALKSNDMYLQRNLNQTSYFFKNIVSNSINYDFVRENLIGDLSFFFFKRAVEVDFFYNQKEFLFNSVIFNYNKQINANSKFNLRLDANHRLDRLNSSAGIIYNTKDFNINSNLFYLKNNFMGNLGDKQIDSYGLSFNLTFGFDVAKNTVVSSSQNINKQSIKVIPFIDDNNNGKKEENEIVIQDLDLSLNNLNCRTNKEGCFFEIIANEQDLLSLRIESDPSSIFLKTDKKDFIFKPQVDYISYVYIPYVVKGEVFGSFKKSVKSIDLKYPNGEVEKIELFDGYFYKNNLSPGVYELKYNNKIKKITIPKEGGQIEI